MLWTPQNQFTWRAGNNADVTVTPGVNNALGSTVQLISGASLLYDVWDLFIFGVSANLATVAKNLFANLRYDPAGGTAWVDLIANIGFHSASSVGHSYCFPIHIPAGSSIGINAQTSHSVAGTLTVRCYVFGRPTRPDVIKKGFSVTTLGANAASTLGTSFTPGSSGAKGSWAQLGSDLTKPHFWWQLAIGINDATMTTGELLCDLGHGDGTNKDTILQDLFYQTVAAGEAISAPGGAQPYNGGAEKSSGGIYVRGAWSTATPDSGYHATAYGVAA